MSYLRLTRATLAFGTLAPFVLAGCASVPLAGAAPAPDTEAIAAAAATAAASEPPPVNGGAPGAARPPGHPSVAAAAAAAAAQAAQAARPFNDVVKDATESKGFFTVRSEERRVGKECRSRSCP